MTALHLSATLALTVGSLAACTSADKSPRASTAAPHEAAAPACAAQQTGAIQTFRETTSNPLSKQDVGVSNVFERDLPDDHGAVAARLSAQLVIHDPDTDAIARETVFAGSVVTIGGDRYCVVAVTAGKDAPGTISLVQLGS